MKLTGIFFKYLQIFIQEIIIYCLAKENLINLYISYKAGLCDNRDKEKCVKEMFFIPERRAFPKYM